MAKYVEHEVAYYYDFHPTEEDLMGETSVHATLVHYLIEVLKWLFRGQVCAVYENLNFYQTSNPREYPLAPDIVVIKAGQRPKKTAAELRREAKALLFKPGGKVDTVALLRKLRR